MEATEIKSWGEVTLVIAGVLALVVAAVRRVYRTARNVEELLTSVRELRAQFEPNGGASVRDAIVRLEAQHIDLRQQIQSLQEDLRRHVIDTKATGTDLSVN